MNNQELFDALVAGGKVEDAREALDTFKQNAGVAESGWLSRLSVVVSRRPTPTAGRKLQWQRPAQIAEAQWRLAIDGAGRFLDAWASLALEFGWTAGELFDVPRDGKPGGLVWFQKGECVRSLGPEHAVLGNGERVFDKLTCLKLAGDSMAAT